MRILYAVELVNNNETYEELIEANCDIHRVYYKFALIEELESEKNTIILSQGLEEDLQLRDIIKIFDMANSNSILIIGEQYRDSRLLTELINNEIYNGVFEDDVDTDYIIHILNNERTMEEAKDYYAIVSDPIVNKEEQRKEKNSKINLFKIFKN
ncbi:hypothetical protein [Clostridium sp.]|uniref:hypothetical protein n=1 Tax=Clostridium sp. TaxID=1506 RepID=UPI003F2C366F